MNTKRSIAFVLAATNHGLMIVNRNDYHGQWGGGGYGVGYQILETSQFDPEEIDLALMLLKVRRVNFGDGVFAIDCGANIGVHTVEWAKSMHGWGSVVAIEAQERIFYALSGNIAINNCFNATAKFNAAGPDFKEIVIPKLDYTKPASFGSLEIQRRPNTEDIGQPINYSIEAGSMVQQIPLDSLVPVRLDFIKIDVEGMEMGVLAGAKNIIEKFKPIILIEILKTNKISIMNFLKPMGYVFFPAGINVVAIHETDPSKSVL